MKAVKMMADYRPALPFSTPLILLIPTYQKSGGVRTKVFPKRQDGSLNLDEGEQIFGTFRTYGGTETTVDGIYSITDTAEVETWYRPDITSDCVIALADTGAVYQVLNEPENIYRRNQFLKFKVKRIKGGA